MSQHFNRLSPSESERLYYLLEELGEAQQAIGKILRHGYNSNSPLIKNNKTNNRIDLATEIGDVLRAIDMLIASRDIDNEIITKTRAKNRPKWLHHN